MRFPPVMSRSQLEKSGYLKSFPNLAGLRLRPARLGGLDSRRGRALRDGRRLDDLADRRGSRALARGLLSGLPDRRDARPLAAGRAAVRHRGGRVSGTSPRAASTACSRSACASSCASARPTKSWNFASAGWTRRRRLPSELGLPFTLDVANDPFFGRVGQIMAVSQRQQALKFELLIPYYPGASPTACMSFNYHREHFGNVWGIRDARERVWPTRAVWPSASIGSRSPCSRSTGSISRQWPAVTRRALAL